MTMAAAMTPWKWHSKASVRQSMIVRLVREVGLSQDHAKQVVARAAELPELRGAVEWADPIIAFCEGIRRTVWGYVLLVLQQEGQTNRPADPTEEGHTAPVQLCFASFVGNVGTFPFDMFPTEAELDGLLQGAIDTGDTAFAAEVRAEIARRKGEA